MTSSLGRAAGLPVVAQPNAERESQLQRALMAFVLVGLFFMLLPGTFLGVWNLVAISSRQDVESLSAAWLQAHGHAQIFGWIGSFILGSGFYSLSKMGHLPPFAISRAWISLALWVPGVGLRWLSGVAAVDWRVLMPLGSALEFAGFLLFFATISRHRSGPQGAGSRPAAWMLLVIASTVGFFISLALNMMGALQAAWAGVGAELPHVFNQRLVAFELWNFLVCAIWGFNARWLPVFLGLGPPREGFLKLAGGALWFAALLSFSGGMKVSAGLYPLATALAIHALRVWEAPQAPAKLQGVHASFPFFIRLAYGWLAAASLLWVAAAWWDQSGGLWGASRHGLTVGFISMMVFAIGQRVLPAFGGARVLYSPRLMLVSLGLLAVGCLLRVAAEALAYEGYWQAAWEALPVSAWIELCAFSIFAVNLVLTFLQPPAHLMRRSG